MKKGIIAGAGVALVIIVAIFVRQQKAKDQEAVVVTPDPIEVSSGEQTQEPAVLPESEPPESSNQEAALGTSEEDHDTPLATTLEESDEVLRRLFGGAFWEELLARDHLIRKVVAAVDLVARNKNPARLFFFMKLGGGFHYEELDGVFYLSPKNYQRYTGLVHAISQVDHEQVVKSYNRLIPLFELAYAELGNPDHRWSEELDRVLQDLVSLEVPDHKLQVLGRKGVYIFAESNIESLPPIHKFFIRMGPKNALTIQKKLRLILRELNSK